MFFAACSMLHAAADDPRAEDPVSFATEPQSDRSPKAIPLFSLDLLAGSSTSGIAGESAGISNSAAPQEQDADQESADLKAAVIGEIRPSFDYAWGDVEESSLPEDFSAIAADEPVSRTIGTPMLLQWQASNLWYHPLYFEDPALERYGHTYSPLMQTLASTGRFVGQAATLPYHATLRPPNSREYPLGWYRPGEHAPYLNYRPAWNNEAAVNQALVVVGLVFLFP
ncbi:MAG: hypothetical protein ABGZ35_29600 [Planctomycetaceae bacterium]